MVRPNWIPGKGTLAFAAGTLLACVCPGVAEEQEGRQPSIAIPKFKTPPGKAKRKSSSGTRKGEDPVRVMLLTPTSHGLTFSAQPTLFWHQSDASKPGRVVFLIGEVGGKRNLAKVRLRRARAKGINRLELSDLGVRLEPGKSYSWSVTYVTSGRSPTLNGVCKGVIKYQQPPAPVSEKLAAASDAQRVQLFAENGVWHDLLATLDKLGSGVTPDPAARDAFEELLRDVGLDGLVRGGSSADL